jgi:hypothetical protein
MILTNRAAITVKVTQAFIDWFNEVDPNKNHKDYRLMVLDADSEGTVYLIPEKNGRMRCFKNGFM